MPVPQLSDFVKAYDVRGLVPEQLNVDVAWALGAAFARAVVAPVFAPVSTPATRRASPVLWLVLGAALVAVLAICVMTLGI